MVLRGITARDRGARKAQHVRRVRIGKTGTGSRCAGHLVQLRIVAVFDAGLAGRDQGFQNLLSDQLADHRLRHPVFLGGANDHARDALHRASSLPRRIPAFSSAHRQRRKDVQVQGHRPGPGHLESTIRDRCDALLPGVHGRARHRHCPVR